MTDKHDARVRHINACIGSAVQRHRKTAKLNQTSLCKALGVDQSAISRIENGKQALTAAQWYLLCDRIGEGLNLVEDIETEMDQ